MSVDVTGGMNPQWDQVLPGRPDQADMRESASMWISDDAGRFGFPRFCLEAVGAQWDNRGIQVNIAFPDGRVLIGTGGFEALPVKNREGKNTVIGAGPLAFECVEPLKRWRMSFHGDAYETTVTDQLRGVTTGPLRRVDIDVDATMAAPPWLPGEESAGRLANGLSNQDAAFLGAVGGSRHEQLFRCSGNFHIEGETNLAFNGSGLRIHRIGARDVGEFRGHCWMSALFPSGKAFGLNIFPPHADGRPAFGDAFVFDGKSMHKARIVEVPWMHDFVAHGGAVDVVLESALGRARITGLTHDSTVTQIGRPLFGNWRIGGQQPPVPFPFHQGGARYTWDGESAYGMIERSYPSASMQRLVER